MLDLAMVSTALRGRVIGHELNFRPRVESTQDVVRAAAEHGAGEGFVALADEQTRGRGRLGRTWVSPSGAGIHASVLMHPDIAALRGLSMIAPLAACRAVEAVTSLQPDIKWPNDIVLGDRKLGGVLIETQFTGNEVAFSIVGIGLNVNVPVSDVEEIRDTATSLLDQLGSPVSRENVLISLLEHLDDLYGDLRRGVSPHAEWRSRLITLGKRVSARTGDRVEHGLAEDVREDGALCLLRDDGSRVVIEAGDVTLRA